MLGILAGGLPKGSRPLAEGALGSTVNPGKALGLSGPARYPKQWTIWTLKIYQMMALGIFLEDFGLGSPVLLLLGSR